MTAALLGIFRWEARKLTDTKRTSSARIGLLTAFDAQSALSAYGAELARKLSAVILAEDEVGVSPHVPSGMRVVRCWNRYTDDLTRLQTAISAQSLTAIHVHLHQPFFHAEKWKAFVAQARATGVRFVGELFEVSSIDPNQLNVLRTLDRVLVPSEQLRLELIAQGLRADQVSVIAASLHNAPQATTGGSSASAIALVTNGLPRNGLQEIIQAAESVRRRIPELSLRVLPLRSAGGNGADYQLENIARIKRDAAHLSWISFPDSWPTASELSEGFGRAAAVVFSSGEPAFEMTQAFLQALALGKPVLAPDVAPFAGNDGRILSWNNRLSIASGLSALLSRADLRAELATRGKELADSRSFDRTVSELEGIYDALTPAPKAPATVAQVVTKTLERFPRILMQCRDNAYTQPGGDTVVMERISEGLRARGLTIDVDLTGEKNPANYDLVHLYNFAVKDSTERLAKRCMQAGVPYVVTTMYEDWPLFFNQMNAYCAAFEQYVAGGQNKDQWPALQSAAKAARPAPIWDNSLTANGAAALIASGNSEAAALRRDYPAAQRIEFYTCGGELHDNADGGELFYKETGLKDFVLCVGRFETRKNQFMLLKALEESDLTVVFAGGGFTYQPGYAALCRQFKRKGNTVFLDRLDGPMLASAFQAAKVHALPGWLELPGIVSIEAAQFGTNVVVTDYGTARDYFGDFAYYCRPDDPESIFNSVMAAYYAPPKAGLREHARTFTWDRTAIGTGETYKRVLEGRGNFDWSFIQEQRIQPKTGTEQAESGVERAALRARDAGKTVGLIPTVVGEPEIDIQDLAAAEAQCTEGDRLLKAGDIEGAKRAYLAGIQAAPRFARSYRSCGVIALNEKRYDQAEEFFRQAIKVDPKETRSLLGLGTVRWEKGEKNEAFNLYLQAAKQNPSDAVSILHLVRTAYSLERLRDLEQALRAFLKTDADNINILYCLAGCSFRRGRLFLANGVVDRILKLEPNHLEAQELKAKIAEEQVIARRQSARPDSARPVAPAAVPSGPAVAASVAAQSIEAKLLALDELKRQRMFDEVLTNADEILASPAAAPEHRMMAEIIKAEAVACRGELDAAEQTLVRLEGQTPYNFRVLAARGAVSAARGAWSDAEVYFKRSLGESPEFDTALAGLGLCAIQLGKNDEAWAFFQRALKTNPENLRAVYGIIQLGYALNRLEETSSALETYLDHHPVDLAINYAYAGCRYALGDRDKAVEELRKILLFEPDHKLALELLAKIESEVKETVHAR
ncbi:MAG: glycosyltransferase [Bdellovibrionota bacterium]